MPEPDYNTGLIAGATMTEAESLRFYNGCVSALANPTFSFSTSPEAARERLGAVIDALGRENMVAYIGFNGTAIIRPRHRERVAA